MRSPPDDGPITRACIAAAHVGCSPVQVQHATAGGAHTGCFVGISFALRHPAPRAPKAYEISPRCGCDVSHIEVCTTGGCRQWRCPVCGVVHVSIPMAELMGFDRKAREAMSQGVIDMLLVHIRIAAEYRASPPTPGRNHHPSPPAYKLNGGALN